MILAVETYKLMQNCKDFGFKDQIQRSAVLIYQRVMNVKQIKNLSNSCTLQEVHVVN